MVVSLEVIGAGLPQGSPSRPVTGRERASREAIDGETGVAQSPFLASPLLLSLEKGRHRRAANRSSP
jgi:hypothetical protein